MATALNETGKVATERAPHGASSYRTFRRQAPRMIGTATTARPRVLRCAPALRVLIVTPVHSRVDMALKRAFDVMFASAALGALLSLMLLIAVLIVVTSPGPIFFSQARGGLNGRPFGMLKFRTMVKNAEAMRVQLTTLNEMTGPAFKVSNDPRVTVIGRYLRRYSLDELPQLVNVLLGHMSIVGPRPLPMIEVAQFRPWQRRRLCVRPGLTAIWQVSGRSRNKIAFDEWMAMDLEYINGWSFWLDMKLILKTLPAVFRGTGR